MSFAHGLFSGAADPVNKDGLFTKAAKLFWHFTCPGRIPGVTVAKMQKVLHVKRPALYPTLDRQLKSLYRPFAADWLPRLSYLDVAISD